MKYCGPEASMVKGKGKEFMSYCTFIVWKQAFLGKEGDSFVIDPKELAFSLVKYEVLLGEGDLLTKIIL